MKLRDLDAALDRLERRADNSATIAADLCNAAARQGWLRSFAGALRQREARLRSIIAEHARSDR